MSSIRQQWSQNNLYLQPTGISREKEERTTNVRNIKHQSLWLNENSWCDSACSSIFEYGTFFFSLSLFLSRVRCLLDPNWNTVHTSQTITRHTLHIHTSNQMWMPANKLKMNYCIPVDSIFGSFDFNGLFFSYHDTLQFLRIKWSNESFYFEMYRDNVDAVFNLISILRLCVCVIMKQNARKHISAWTFAKIRYQFSWEFQKKRKHTHKSTHTTEWLNKRAKRKYWSSV